MAFLRRGNVAFLHHPLAAIVLHRIGGMPVRIRLADISCYEEHVWPVDTKIVTFYFTNNSSVAVRETFDAIATELAAKEVPHAKI